VTPTSPRWGDIRRFLVADGWREIAGSERGGPRSRHVFFEKALDDGRVLETHISHADDKTVSAGRFGEMLRTQLEVSRAEFWECIRTQTSVDRPVPVDRAPVEHPAWVIQVLTRDLRMTSDRIAALSPEAARELVNEHRSRPG
jgi:hypothetical protein